MKLYSILNILALIVTSSVSARDWFVDNAATGSNSGANWSDAWSSFASIQWNALAGGDTIFISGGTESKTYPETLMIVWPAASESARLTIRCGQDAGHNGKVIIEGGPAIKLGNESGKSARFVTVDGSYNGKINLFLHGSGWPAVMHRYKNSSNNIYRFLDVRTGPGGSQTHGFQLSDNAHNTVISDCRFHDIHRTAIREGRTDTFYPGRIKILNNEISGHKEDGIKISGGVDVIGNVIDGSSHVSSLHPDGIQTTGGSWNIVGNKFHDHLQEIFIETIGTNLQEVLIANNVFYEADPTDAGLGIVIKAAAPEGKHTWEGIKIVNNTFVGLKNAALRFQARPGIEVRLVASRLRNNIFADNNGHIIMNGADEGKVLWDEGEFPWEYNLFHPMWVKHQDSPMQSLSAVNQEGIGEGNISKAPLFASRETHDYRLLDGSAGIGGGISDADVLTDFSGDVRSSDRIDLGAFQASGGVPKPPAGVRVID